MVIRYVATMLLALSVYALLAFLVLAPLPKILVPEDRFSVLSDPSARQRLLVAERVSVRAGGVALLGGSALGAAGLIAFLAYTGTRRDAAHLQRKNDNDLFAKALELVAEPDKPTAVGAVALMTDLAKSRPDLGRAAAVVAFQLVRTQCLMTNRLVATPQNRTPGSLADRARVAVVALELIGSVAPPSARSGAVLRRELDLCDFRGLRLNAVHFELVNFANSVFWDCRLADCSFHKCSLGQTDWLGAKLRGVVFRECDLTAVDFATVDLSDVRFEHCTGAPQT